MKYKQAHFGMVPVGPPEFRYSNMLEQAIERARQYAIKLWQPGDKCVIVYVFRHKDGGYTYMSEVDYARGASVEDGDLRAEIFAQSSLFPNDPIPAVEVEYH